MTGAEPRGYGDLPACIGVIAWHEYAPSTPNDSEKKSSFFFLLFTLTVFPCCLFALSPYLSTPRSHSLRRPPQFKGPHVTKHARKGTDLNKEAIDPAHIRKEGTTRFCARKTLFGK